MYLCLKKRSRNATIAVQVIAISLEDTETQVCLSFISTITMNTFGPRQVETSSWQRWLKEAVHLSGKHLALNVCLVLLTIGLLSPFPTLVLTVISPVLLGAFVLLAYSADTSEPVLATLKAAFDSLLRLLFCSALTVCSIIAALFVIVLMIKGSVIGPQTGSTPYIAQAHQISEFLAGSKALFSIGAWLLVILPWFAIPLIVCTPLPLRDCLELTFAALNQNKFVVVVIFLCSLIIMAGALFHGLTVVPLYPILGGLLYASYRHIFLGLPPMELKPAKVKSAALNRRLQTK